MSRARPWPNIFGVVQSLMAHSGLRINLDAGEVLDAFEGEVVLQLLKLHIIAQRQQIGLGRLIKVLQLGAGLAEISSATFYKWKAKYGGEVSEAKRLKALNGRSQFLANGRAVCAA